MNGKAIIGQCTDAPVNGDPVLRYSFQVSFFSTVGFVTSELIDVIIQPTETVAQIRSRVRSVIIARGAEIGLTIATADVGSIMQI